MAYEDRSLTCVAARATFALNSAEWLRRGRLLISRSCLREHYHALNQAAIPLIPLFTATSSPHTQRHRFRATTLPGAKHPVIQSKMVAAF